MTAVIALCLSQVPQAAVAQPVERDLAKVEAAGSTPAGRSCMSARRAIAFYARRAREWREQMGARGGMARTNDLSHSCPRLRLRAQEMRWRSWVARSRFERWFQRMYEKYRCVHEHEAAWDDPDAPHWGGLQLDLDFQRDYGHEFLRRFGLADRWPVWAQLLAAERAFRKRGFKPWPNTARECGLL